MLVVEADPTHPAHYAKCAIEPIEYIVRNNLDFCEGNIIKYVTRYKAKHGLEDLQKAKYYLERLISKVEGGSLGRAGDNAGNAGSDNYTLKCTKLDDGTMRITREKSTDTGEGYA